MVLIKLFQRRRRRHRISLFLYSLFGTLDFTPALWTLNTAHQSRFLNSCAFFACSRFELKASICNEEEGTVNKVNNAFSLLSNEIQLSLSEKLGIIEPNEVQNSSIPIVLRGDDVFVVAQTGSGKTMTFLLPILQRLNSTITSRTGSKRAIIIGPTVELVAQHFAVATKLAPPSLVDCVFFTTPEQLLEIIRKKRNMYYPGATSGNLMADIEIVAIDEVDAVLCGSEFEDTVSKETTELLNYLQTRNKQKQAQLILTTAHLTLAHRKVLDELFPSITKVRHSNEGGRSEGVLVPTLRQEFHYFSGGVDDKLIKLNRILQRTEDDNSSIVIFCRDADEVEIVHSSLEKNKMLSERFSPRKLHEDIHPDERAKALNAFLQSTSTGANFPFCRILITHEIAARGLDCPNVSTVILYDTPTDVTAFVHRAGRTARAGRSGSVICLVQAEGCFDGGNHKVLHELQDAPKLKFRKDA